LLGAPLVLGPREDLKIHVFVDTSVVEVFGNDRVASTIRSYPEKQDSTRIGIFARQGGVRAASIDVWKMRDTGVRPKDSF
jgi:beta-fructofuranosidase